jgi:hypothetical protein
MKKLIGILLLTSAMAAGANPYNHGKHHNHHQHRSYNNHMSWVVPAIIGGVLVYGATQPAVAQPVPQQQVFIQREPVLVPPQTVCYAWKEIQTADGHVYRERTCYQR